MRKPWFIVAAWLLLLVPTLVIGGLAMHLLRHEQERIADAAVAAAGERAAAIAESLSLAVTEVEEGLIDTLRSLPRQELAARLDAWRQENPLIRNVFIWQKPVGVTFPPPSSPGNAEEEAFLRRYQALFARRDDWSPPRPDVAAGAQGVASGSAAPSPAAEAYASRRELRKLVQAPAAVSAEAAAEAEPSSEAAASGWIPWFSQDRLHLLGWVEPSGSGLRYGVEVEMMALLSRLVGQLPQTGADEEVYVLVDGSGRIVSQSGGAPFRADEGAVVTLNVGNALPHWQLRVYSPPAGFSETDGRGFLVLSGLLVAAVVAAIVFGGSLLLWQAWRHQRDARRKTSFVSNVSHELKTPLTTIRMYAELMEEGKVCDDAKRRRYLQVIVDESRRLTRLVNNVLDFSRLEQGRKSCAPEEVELKEFLEQLLEAQTMRLQQAGMSLQRRFAEGPLRVRADRDALEQVVLNIIDNAIKYAASGAVLDVELEEADGLCRLRILDRGPGVPAAHRRRIFETFHRVDDSLTSSQQGSGLGLSIARALVREMGGDLHYTSRPGGGACFEVSMPRMER